MGSRESCFYQNETERLFRPYHGQGDSNAQCQYSVKNPPRPHPAKMQLCPSADVDQLALAVFLQDYCLAPRDPLISRGYLSSLQSMLLAGSSKSNLAEATRLVALSSLGNKLRNLAITRRACLSYPGLLRSFQATISHNPTMSTVESLTIVVLLGLYEVSEILHATGELSFTG